jgi:multifunctional 2-oxoglutarate metabolism enzyme
MAVPETLPVTLPQMGESVTEGTVVAWRKKEGDSVEAGETIAEVTTDKVDVEVPSPAAGVLARIVVQEGQTVEVGAVLAELRVDGAAAPADGGETETAARGGGSPAAEETAEVDSRLAAANGQKAAAGPGAPAVEAAPDATAAPPAAGATPPGDAERGRVVEVTLPAMGESVTEGIVARWVKRPGDSVSVGEAIVEVTTDKVDAEVPSPVAGRLGEIRADEGATVEVGAVLATVIEGAAAQPPAPAVEPPAALAPQPAPAVSAAPSEPAAPSARARPEIAASPLARRAAALAGVDLARVRGTGPGGMVRKHDVAAAARTPQPASQPTAPAPDGAQPLRGPAAALATAMEQSREIPTATSFRTIEVDVLDARRRELNAAIKAAGRPEKVSFTHLIGYAIVRAAVDVPNMSAHFERDGEGKPFAVNPGVHLGLAVDTTRKDGSRFLVVPVIKDAATRSFAQFRDEYERLVAKARTNSLTADDIKGSSITLTNPGGIGTVASVPRLMHGNGTIVATGSIDWPQGLHGVGEARLRDMGVGKVMTMTSTYDHRVIQGAESGEFLRRIEQLLHGEDGFYGELFRSLDLPAPAAEPLVPKLTDQATVEVVTGQAAGHELLAAVGAGMSLVKAHRTHGHLGAYLDPLGLQQPIGDPAMEPATVHLTPALMQAVPADVLRVYVPGSTLAEVLPRLRETYCSTIAYEIEHLSSHEQRVWLREHIESGKHRVPMSPERRLQLLERLTRVDAMERYLRRSFLGQKTFSIEGLDAMVPMLEELITMAADDGIDQAIMGMAHRGRLAVTAHVVNRPYESVLVTFEQGEQKRPIGTEASDPTGDVKYHLGAQGTYVTESGKPVSVKLLPNPSHLEAVDPVVEGWTRAEQTRRHSAELHVDPKAAMPVLIHGDAAFPGQGVVAEVLNLQSLQGYSTGGTVHLIANNQVGFTTDPNDSRSTRYASDLAKGFDIPVIHVNADDVEACIHAMRLAYDYRRTYHRDVVIDLVGYRRFGHNENDEPAYTQPVMYRAIKDHPTVRELFAQRLVHEGLLTQEDSDRRAEEAFQRVAGAHQKVKASMAAAPSADPADHSVADARDMEANTGVPAKMLIALNEQLLTLPEAFHLHPKLTRQVERRRELVTSGEIDWATGESLAFASLLVQGHPIRLTGQDTERGTFSQRHLSFHDVETGGPWTPMQHLVGATATFELHNSPLSEAACLGFEYGYSVATPDTLVIWEAQFGDFVNNAQVIVDQFIAGGQAKWGQQSRLTLLLPHGYEGAGPEHSSARLERFLQLSANGSIRVANCSTAGQYFHLLRQQALAPKPRPLVVMTPKWLLRVHDSASRLDDLVKGRFRRVIDDPSVPKEGRGEITTLLLCSGKIYYELIGHPLRAEAQKLAIARIELLDPFPIDEVMQLFKSYPNLNQIFWVQEEPMNMGAWYHLARRIGKRRPYDIRWDYIGRPRRASPSEGFSGAHQIEQERIIATALRSVDQVPERTPVVMSPPSSEA